MARQMHAIDSLAVGTWHLQSRLLTWCVESGASKEQGTHRIIAEYKYSTLGFVNRRLQK